MSLNKEAYDLRYDRVTEPTAAKKDIGFSDSFSLGLESFRLTDQSHSELKAYNEEIEKRQKFVEENYPDMDGISVSGAMKTYDQYSRKRIPSQTAQWIQEGKLIINQGEDGVTFSGINEEWDKYAKDNEGELQRWNFLNNKIFLNHPEYSDDAIRKRVVGATQKRYMELQKEMQDAGIMGTFAGGMAGVMSDPVNILAMVLTAPFGGATGYGLAGNSLRAAGREAVIGMGSEAIIQGGIMDWKEEITGDYDLNDAMLNIAMAGAGGAFFGAAGSAGYDLNIMRKASGKNGYKESFDRWDRMQGYKMSGDIQGHYDTWLTAQNQDANWEKIDLTHSFTRPKENAQIDDLVHINTGEYSMTGRVIDATDETITVQTVEADGTIGSEVFSRADGLSPTSKNALNDGGVNPIVKEMNDYSESKGQTVEPVEDPKPIEVNPAKSEEGIIERDILNEEIDAENLELDALDEAFGLKIPEEDAIIPPKEKGDLDGKPGRNRTDDEEKSTAPKTIDSYRKASPKGTSGGNGGKANGNWTYTPGGRISGVLQLDTYSPTPTVKTLIEADGGTPLTFESHTNAKQFHADITDMKEASTHGAAVYVYTPEEYAKMKLFTTADGKVGFAIKDGDLVSVFKHPDSSVKGAMDSIVPLAKEQGAVKLDAFDTMLTGAYKKYGFNTKAKMPFNEEYKPEGWDPKQFADYNEGKPDVDYMVLDPDGDGKSPIRTEDYDKAVAVQTAEVKRIWPDLSNKQKIDMMPSLAPETVGALYGFEEDENGNWTYNVSKGILGAIGGRMARKAISGKGMKAAILKHLNDIEETAMRSAGGGTPPKVDLVSQVTKDLEGASNKQKNMIIGKAMRNATPEEKEILIDMMKKSAPAKTPKPKSEKAKVMIEVREEFNDRFYSKLDHEIDQMPDDIVFKTQDDLIKYLEEKGVSKAELEGAGIGRTFKEVGSIKKNELESAMKYREDRIYKKTSDPEEDLEPADYDQWESDFVDVREWDQAPNWVDSESGLARMVYDEYTGNESYITEKWHEDLYIDDSGYEYDYEGIGKDWLTEHADQNYVDEAFDAIKEGSLDVDASGWLNQQLAKARTTENAELETRMKELEKVGEGFDEYLEDAMTGAELKEAITNQDAGDDVNEFRIEQARDNGDVYDHYNNKTYYEDEHGRTFDTEDDAIEGVKEMMYADYEDRFESGDNDRLWADYTVDGGENYRVSVYQMDDFVARTGNVANEPHWGDLEGGAQNIQVHARMKDRVDAEDKTGVVLEEIQSQWEQDWRKEGGGAKPPSAKKIAEAKVINEEIGTKVHNLVKEQEEARQRKEVHKKALSKMRMEYKEAPGYADKLNVMYEEADRLENLSEKLRKEALADRELHGVWSDEKKAVYNKAVQERNAYMDGIDSYTAGYKELPEYKETNSKVAMEQATENRLREEKEIAAGKQREVEAILNPKKPYIAAPPLQRRSTYERLALMDNLMEAAEDGKDFFGFNNASIQNGSQTPKDTYVGMRNAMNLESPNIIKKWTGETPYKAYHDPADNPGGDKVYWNYKKAEVDGFNSTPGEIDNVAWYWRVDIDDALRDKLKKMDVPVYGILLGLGLGSMAEGENDGSI